MNTTKKHRKYETIPRLSSWAYSSYNSKGEITLVALFTIVVLILAGWTAGRFLGDAADYKFRTKRLTENVSVSMTKLLENVHKQKRITRADFEILKYKVNKHSKLLDKLGNRIRESHKLRLKIHGILTAIKLGAMGTGAHADNIVAASSQGRQIPDESVGMILRALGVASSVETTLIAYVTRRKVVLDDVKDELTALKTAFQLPEDDFVKAQVAGYIRKMVDFAETKKLATKAKVSICRCFA